MSDPTHMPQACAAGSTDRRADLCIALLLALFCLGIYNANWRVITASDTFAARFLPFSILHYHTLYFENVESVASEGRTHPYWIIPGRDGRMVSRYPIVTPLLVTPLYIPAVLWLDARGWTDHRVDRVARLMEKLSASLVAALCAGLMYLLLRRRAGTRIALLLTVAFAFGTNTWGVGSQGLWQHGMAELLLTAMLLIVTGPCTEARALLAGALCTLITFNRSPDALFAMATGLYSLLWARRDVKIMALIVTGAVIPCALLLAYNIGMVGNFLGGDGVTANAHFYRFHMPAGVAGLLFSPARGLFVFTPFLLALPLGAWRIFSKHRPAVVNAAAENTANTPAAPGDRPLYLFTCIAFVIQVMVYAKTDWRDGAAWGPRYLTDVLPLFLWMLVPVINRMGRAGFAAFLPAVGVSIAIQVVGAFWYTGKSDEALSILDTSPAAMNAVWNLHNTPFILEARHRHALHDLTYKVDGAIDGIAVAGRETTQAPAGTPITVSGWTLTGHAPPWRVIVQIVPAGGKINWNYTIPHPLQDTLVFHPRPGAGPVPSAWSATLQTPGLKPGDYIIEVTAQAADGAEFLPVDKRGFRVLPAQQ